MSDLAKRRSVLDAQIAALNAEAEERAGEVEFAIAREKFEADAIAARARSISAKRGVAHAKKK